MLTDNGSVAHKYSVRKKDKEKMSHRRSESLRRAKMETKTREATATRQIDGSPSNEMTIGLEQREDNQNNMETEDSVVAGADS